MMVCDIPPSAPWRVKPDGCAIVRPGKLRALPLRVTEVDLWTKGGKRLAQTREDYPDSCSPTWSFATPYRWATAGWDTCNQMVWVGGRLPVRVYWWFS